MTKITLSRWSKAPYIFVNGDLPDRVEDALDTELSYEVPDASHTDAWKQGRWDGRHRLLRESSNGNRYFPTGCLDIARDVLDSFGVEYDLDGVYRPGQGDLDLAWDTDMTLREYQQDAVDEALRRGTGVVVMPTGAGKTVVGLRLMYRLKRPTLVLCHRQEIADQWVEQIEDILGVDPAVAYAGDDESGDIQVALYQTVYQDGEVRDDIRLDHDVLLPDEAHRVGAETFSRVTMACNARYRFGFTATKDREDNATLRVIGGTGGIISDISPENLIRQGYLAEPEWRIREAPSAGRGYRNWQQEYRGEIVENGARNQMIAGEVVGLDFPCYVHVERIDHGERLENRIGDGARFVHADTTDREETIQAFKDGDLPVLISTLLGEGVDVPEMASMVMAGGLKTSVGAIQKVGRALRPDTETATIVDFIDNGRWVGEHSEQRIRVYKNYYGEYGP